MSPVVAARIMTPHGFLKAAMAGNATAIPRMQGNRKTTIVSFTALGKYKVNGTINDQNQVELVQTDDRKHWWGPVG